VSVCACRFVRRTLRFAALASAFATIPAAAASADPASQLEFLPDASPVSFGAVTVGQPNVKSLTLKNTSGVSANINGLTFSGPDASEFGPHMSFCAPSLPAGASCNFAIRFTPSHPGSFTAQLEVNYDGVNSPLTRQLSGTGVAPNLMLSPSALDFGIVLAGERDEMNSVMVQNVGGAPAQINQLDIDGPDASAFRVDPNTCQPQTLAIGQVCPVSVRFEPEQDRTYNATLHLRVGGTDFTAALTGVGGVSDVVMTPDPLDFGRVQVGSSSMSTVTARSTGNAPFQSIVTVLTGGDVGDLRIVKDVCSLRMLLPGQTCTMTVRFTPTTVGHVEAALAVVDDGQPHTAMVRGEGTEPATALPAPATPARGARVAFNKKSQAAPISHSRVRLGRARCKGAPTCTVTVHTQFAVKLDGARRAYFVRGRTQKWTLRHSRPVSIPLPRGVRGTLSRVTLTMKTHAPGHPVTVQRKLLRLTSAKN
jgi:Abnormal spindle-like microcephaly-assoc'd, ASPM-SPD-2-Hydin